MASKTINIIGGRNTDEESEDKKFSDFSCLLTRAFTDRRCSLQDNLDDMMARGPKESEKVEKIYTKPIETVLERLIVHADALNEQLLEHQEREQQALINQRSIWDIGYNQFESTCNNLLTTCQGYCSSAWEQVTLVYVTASRLLATLRETGPNTALREQQMERFAGDFINGSPALRQMIDTQGGMENFGLTQVPVADIRGTEV